MLYIAGTRIWRWSGLRDIRDDMRLPFGKVREAARYRAAADHLRAHPYIHTVIGHSLGGSVAIATAHDFNKKWETWANPGVSWKKDPRKHRHWGDPISMFDRGATSTAPGWNPHGYD